MRRGHRRAHGVLWLVLGPIAAAVLVWAVVDRADTARLAGGSVTTSTGDMGVGDGE